MFGARPTGVERADAITIWIPIEGVDSARRRDGWHLVWIVPTEERLGWLRRVARWDPRSGLEHRSWGLVLDELRATGLMARTQPVGWSGEAVSLEAVIADPRLRRCLTPVGSPGWIRLLGSGGAEETDEALV